MSDAFDPADAPEPSPTRPRPERSRRRSRLNARVHGLTANLPDGAEEAELMQQFADKWTAQLGADTDAEEALIRASAIAYARLERCRKAERAALRTASSEAVKRWEQRRRHAVRKRAQGLALDPFLTVMDLESTSFGCEWLMRAWLRIDAALAQGIPLDRHDRARVMLLQGLQPQAPGPDADPAIRRAWHLAQACAAMPPAAPVAERTELRRMIAGEFERLEALRLELWERQDGPEAESVAAQGMVDTTKEGQLRHRYQREAFSQMMRGINQVMRIRVERSKDQDRQWHQAHPHVSRRRVPDMPSRNPGFANVAPDEHPASPLASGFAAPEPPLAEASRPEATRAADHRNEPQTTAAETADGRLNPNSGNEMRRDPSAGPAADDRRTGPRLGAPSPVPGGPKAAPSTPAEAPRGPSGGDRRA